MYACAHVRTPAHTHARRRTHDAYAGATPTPASNCLFWIYFFLPAESDAKNNFQKFLAGAKRAWQGVGDETRKHFHCSIATLGFVPSERAPCALLWWSNQSVPDGANRRYFFLNSGIDPNCGKVDFWLCDDRKRIRLPREKRVLRLFVSPAYQPKKSAQFATLAVVDWRSRET